MGNGGFSPGELHVMLGRTLTWTDLFTLNGRRVNEEPELVMWLSYCQDPYHGRAMSLIIVNDRLMWCLSSQLTRLT